MITGIVLLIAGLVAYLHSVALVRQGRIRELIVFYLLMTPGTVLSIMAANLMIIQEPLQFLEWIYKPVNDFFSRLVS